MLFTALLSLLLLAGCSPSKTDAEPTPPDNPPRPQQGTLFVITQGDYEEVPTVLPARGIAICGKANGASRMIESDLAVTTIPAPPNMPEGMPMKRVNISGCDTKAGEAPWFLMQDPTSTLRLAEVITLLAPKPDAVSGLFDAKNTPLKNKPFTGTLNKGTMLETTYRIHEVTTPVTTVPVEVKLYLSDGRKEQTFLSASHQFEPNVTMLWAGDLDGDHKLDFLLNRSEDAEDFGKLVNELYLSTYASPGNLVGLGGQFSYYVSYD